MEKIGFDFENVGGLAECYAIPVNLFKRIRVDYLRGLRNLELTDRSSVIAIPMYADDSFSHKEEKKHADGGDYWEVDIEGVVPKWCKGVEGLLTCGRCISGTHRAHASYRVMFICFATGQAAGIAAALSARKNIVPRQLDVSEIQDSLRKAGVSLFD